MELQAAVVAAFLDAGAKVTLRNEGIGVSTTTLSRTHGTCIFTPIRIGLNTVTAEFPGFETARPSHIEVNIRPQVVQAKQSNGLPLNVRNFTSPAQLASGDMQGDYSLCELDGRSRWPSHNPPTATTIGQSDLTPLWSATTQAIGPALAAWTQFEQPGSLNFTIRRISEGSPRHAPILTIRARFSWR